MTRTRAIQGFSEWGYITYQKPRFSWWARLRAAWRRDRKPRALSAFCRLGV